MLIFITRLTLLLGIICAKSVSIYKDMEEEKKEQKIHERRMSLKEVR